MTLPTDINLPIAENLFNEGSRYNVETYLKELVNRLTDMYQMVAQNVNGYIKEWTPTIYGVTTTGSGTYGNQYGWIRRSGIITECWIDISWTAHTGNGSAAILMPYQAALSNGTPFVGVLESSGSNNFGGKTYLTWRVEPDSTQGSIIANGSGAVSVNLALSGSGGFRGYIRYIGKEFED